MGGKPGGHDVTEPREEYYREGRRVKCCWAVPENGFRSMVTLARPVMMVTSRREKWLGHRAGGGMSIHPFPEEWLRQGCRRRAGGSGVRA